MVKFFVPGLEDPAEAESFYAILRAVASARHGAVSGRRICEILFSRGRQAHGARVGEADTVSGLPCVAIFEAARGGLYFIYAEGPISRTGHPVAAPHYVEAFDAEDEPA
jgi:hypothetical protein